MPAPDEQGAGIFGIGRRRTGWSIDRPGLPTMTEITA
ncbi:hypothetical protein PSP31121_02171 [Pandoraea sputorum]|uniref:Uncharacterized protein n=1 Tax=Pandoraea sputorum TaxID=93222 RepID=A0A5E5B4Q1_9BURK|nr:hypothetical protein PSP31121_02171 [Pandoraea sputorum]